MVTEREKEFIVFKSTEISMKVNTQIIRKKGMEHTITTMVISIKDSSRMSKVKD